MNRQRLRLARRLADIEAFREERQRQQFADAARDRRLADENNKRATEAREALELARDDALAEAGMARYLLLGEMAAGADLVRQAADEAASQAAGKEEMQRDAWTQANVRKHASEDRAQALHHAWAMAADAADTTESMERWLARRGGRV